MGSRGVCEEGEPMVDNVVRWATIEVANVVEELSTSVEEDDKLVTSEVMKDTGDGEVPIVASCACESVASTAIYSSDGRPIHVKWGFPCVAGIVLAVLAAANAGEQCGAEGAERFGMGRSGRGQV
jgi:hypothetical protein